MLVKLLYNLYWIGHARTLAGMSASFFDEGEFLEAKRNYIRTKLQDLPPGDYLEPRSSQIHASSEDGIVFFIRALTTAVDSHDPKFFLVLADSGMGKTTFLMNLLGFFYRMPRFDGLRMRLITLGDPVALKTIEDYPEEDRGSTILLLDAFDEDPLAFEKGKQYHYELMGKVSGFKKVVITCRRQFYGADSDIPRTTGLSRHGPNAGPIPLPHKYVAPFSEDDVTKYLKKKFRYKRSRVLAQRIVDKAKHLMARPMLLAHISDLIEARREFVNSADIYAVLVKRWISREADKIRAKTTHLLDHEKRLEQFADEVVLEMLRQRNAGKGFYVSLKDIERIAGLKDVNLNAIVETRNSARSLLASHSDGRFKFAHLSIFEFLLAQIALRNTEVAAELTANNYEGLGQAQVFLRELLRVPPPNGYFFAAGVVSLCFDVDRKMKPDSVEADFFTFLLAEDGSIRHLVCWPDANMDVIATILKFESPTVINLWLLPSKSYNSTDVARWCKLVEENDSIRIKLMGTRFPATGPVVQMFNQKFSEAGLRKRLDQTNGGEPW